MDYGALADVLGGAGGNAASSRQKDDQLKIAVENARLNRQKFAETAPQERLSTAIRAAIAKNATPTTVSWGGPGSGLKGQLPQFGGGIKAAIQGVHDDPYAQGTAGLVGKDEMAAEQQGGLTGGNQDRNMSGLNDVGNSSLLENALGGGGIISSLLKAFGMGGGGNKGGGDSSGQNGEYDPWSDPKNYDADGNYIGEGAFDENGNYTLGGSYSGGGNGGGGDTGWNDAS